MNAPLVIVLILTARITAAESTELVASSTDGLTLSIADTGNRAWDVEYATSLAGKWTSMGSVRVANSSLDVFLGMPGSSPSMFFRAKSLDNQSALSSPADLLDITSYNFANPSLPAHLLTPQIIGQDNTPVGNSTTDPRFSDPFLTDADLSQPAR